MRLCLLLPLLLMVYACNYIMPVNHREPFTVDTTSAPQFMVIGGAAQAVMVHGTDTSHPILLMLHGGPGVTSMGMFEHYNKILENHFIVVNWDQRGAGLSYSSWIPKSSLTIKQYVNDAHDLVTYLKKKYQKKKIYVLGHSWGTVLGIMLAQKYPEDFYAYIGASQVVHMKENRRQCIQYLLESAIAEGNREAIKDLTGLLKNYPPDSLMTSADVGKEYKWLDYYHGSHHEQTDVEKLYGSLEDSLNPKPFATSTQEYLGANYVLHIMGKELLQIDLFSSVPELKVPAYFLTGAHDYQTPFRLAEFYYQRLRAPYKEFIWFEKAAHQVPWEDTAKFHDVLINKVRKHSHPR